MVDKSIDNTKQMKSVRTQYDPLYAAAEQSEVRKPTIQVKITKPKIHVQDEGISTDLSFSPNANISFYTESQLSDKVEILPESSSDTDCIDSQYDRDTSYLIESDDSDSDSDTSQEEDKDNILMFSSSSSPGTEPKFLVFWSCLLSLFQSCSICFKRNNVIKTATRGSMLTVTTKCENNHEHKWFSQPLLNGRSASNLLLSAAISYSGNTFTRILKLMNYIHIAFFSRTVFYGCQKNMLFPAVNTVYKRYREKCLTHSLEHENINVIGDGRCDSPGYSAKYGTYTLMSSDSNEILDFHVVHVSTAGNSSQMEKKGLEILLEKFNNMNINVTSLTNVQIRSFLKKRAP